LLYFTQFLKNCYESLENSIINIFPTSFQKNWIFFQYAKNTLECFIPFFYLCFKSKKKKFKILFKTSVIPVFFTRVYLLYKIKTCHSTQMVNYLGQFIPFKPEIAISFDLKDNNSFNKVKLLFTYSFVRSLGLKSYSCAMLGIFFNNNL